MAYSRLIFCVVCLVVTTFTQVFAGSSITEILADKQQITHENSQEFNHLMKLNVIGYYKMEDTYDTELKRKNYQKTNEYKENLEQMTILKRNALGKQYYIRFQGETFETEIYNYDIKKQGIILKFHSGLDVQLWVNNVNLTAHQSHVIAGVLFYYLPIQIRKWSTYSGQHFIDDLLFVPMSEEHGALKENNKKLVDVIITFNVNGSSHSDYVEAHGPSILYLVNRNTGEIYFEKTYQYRNLPPKKEAKKAKTKKNP
jgi:hypothetical protein